MKGRRVLTTCDHARIRELAERGWKVGRISREIGQRHSTVYWFMLREALVERRPGNRDAAPYERGGRLVYPWSREEDAFIESSRASGLSSLRIASQVSEKFGKPRTAHSVLVRLVMLAATPETQGDAA